MNDEDPWPTPLGSPEGSSAMPIRHAHAHPLRRNLAEPGSTTTSAWSSGTCLSLRLSIYDNTLARPMAPAPPTMLVKAQVQEDMPRAIEAWGSLALPLVHSIVGHFLDKVMHETWHKKTKLPRGLQGLGGSRVAAGGPNVRKAQRRSKDWPWRASSQESPYM
jgi:hypothetical protein